MSELKRQTMFVTELNMTSLYLTDFKGHDEVSHVLRRVFLEKTFSFV